MLNFQGFINEELTVSMVNGAIMILNQYDNKPMSSREIWAEIAKQNLCYTRSSNPPSILSGEMSRSGRFDKVGVGANVRYIIRKDEQSKGISDIKNEYLTWINASLKCLKNNNNTPLSAEEIWNVIKDEVKTLGKTPISSLRVMLDRSDKFKIVKPYDHSTKKYIMSVESNSSDVESEDMVDGVVDGVVNPFGAEKNTSAVCILGRSGAGKSYRIERTLEEEDHNYELIIPTAATTNLLVQYSRGSYELSRLGKIILESNSNPSEYYTAVFDECHKYIDMINDELLQCISTRRNNGLRFISLDPSTDELFQDLEEDRGRRVIPDNLGFIFISSKEEIIRNNSDFYNRVDIVTIDREDRDIEFAIGVLKDKIEEREDEEYSNE